MNIRLALWQPLLLFTFSGAIAAAEDSLGAPPLHPQRACTAEDLLGSYVEVSFQETPPGKETEWRKNFPFHYLGFYKNGSYGTLAIDQQVKEAWRLDKQLMPKGKGKPTGNTYVLSPNGMLDLYTGKKLNYSYQCIANVAANGDYLKGDLILTGYTKDQKSQLDYVYRRWY